MIHTVSICHATFLLNIHTYSSACVRDDDPSSVHGDGVHNVCGHGDGVHSDGHISPTNRLLSEYIECYMKAAS